jgi:hypothetical protein
LSYYGDYGLNRATLKVSPKQTAVAVKRRKMVNSQQPPGHILDYSVLYTAKQMQF